MDRNLALEFVRVTEAAAIAAAGWVGRGEAKKADAAAVDEMRGRFNQIAFKGRVVIGEGQKDEAPELYVGEKVGRGWKQPSPRLSPIRLRQGFVGQEGRGMEAMDLAVDPLECTDSVAFGRYNALSVIAAGAKGSLFSAPDTYMKKIAVGPKAKGFVKLEASTAENLRKIAKALGKKIQDLTVCVLDRERHKDLIAQIRRAKARVRLITDGDVAGAIAPCMPESGIDALMGIGASAEAVLAATAVKILGGELLARFHPFKVSHRQLLQKHRLNDRKIYTSNDLAKGKVLNFTATGIIDGPLLQGVRFYENSTVTHSLAIRGQSGTIRYITTHHHSKHH